MTWNLSDRRAARMLPAWVVFAAGLLLPIVAAAQPAAAPATVLYLNEDNPRVAVALDKLRHSITRSEWHRRHPVHLQHVTIDPRSDTLEQDIRRALETKPAAVIAPSLHYARLAKKASGEVPIIFGSHQDPVGAGLVASMQEPGGNLTGNTMYAPVEAKRIELLRELRPGMRTLGVVVDRWWPMDPASRHFDEMVRTRFGIKTRHFRADSAAELARVLSDAGAGAVDGWYVIGEPGFSEPEATARAINATGKPSVYTMGMLVGHGGLMSYQAIQEDPFASFAKLLGMIMQGTPAGRIPVEGPKVFELQLNQDTARRLGISFPRKLLMRATRVHDTPKPRIEKSPPGR